MKILVIGGTYFLGKCCVEKLIQLGHFPVLLNRGSKEIFPQLETIRTAESKIRSYSRILPL